MDRNNFEVNLQVMKQKSLGKYAILKGLYQALDNDELLLQYQPKIDGKTNKLVGMEALVRWHHPENGLLYPTEFLPLAEETGLVKHLDKWVLSSACKQIKHWQNLGYANLRLAINLSDWQFRQETLPELVKSVLTETGLDASSLELEIKDIVTLENQNFTVRNLAKLINMGVKISIDYFRSSSLSISYLKHLPAHYLKIDKSFIADILKDKNSLIIVKAIIDIAHAIGLKVIAEGVEAREQLVLLQSMNCDELQGFYISKPLHVEDVEKQYISARAV